MTYSVEVARRIIIKKEMNERITKGRKICDDGGNPSAKMKTPWNPSVKVIEKHNIYTRPMKFGKPLAPLMK